MINSSNYSIDCFHNAVVSKSFNTSKKFRRNKHLLDALKSTAISGHVMEFGVWQGKTISIIGAYFCQQKVWGFDSFVGLPEPWFTKSTQLGPSHPAGKFGLDGKELVSLPNVELIAGWFNDSIPVWKEQNSGNICFLHIDCDLYSSTATVLTLLNDRIVPGTVIVFDEMYPWADYNQYDLWEQGEFKALGEWLLTCNREFVPLFHSQHQQCSLRVTK
jgi:Macrocin-O-methyltransferase (TylF)